MVEVLWRIAAFIAGVMLIYVSLKKLKNLFDFKKNALLSTINFEI